jgi:hypothetical protein
VSVVLNYFLCQNRASEGAEKVLITEQVIVPTIVHSLLNNSSDFLVKLAGATPSDSLVPSYSGVFPEVAIFIFFKKR